MEVIAMLLNVFQSSISMFFTLEVVPGVSLGWIFMVVVIMFLIIRIFLKGGSENG